jgi:hypothetical protein
VPTSKTGAYTFTGLPSGDYWVIATDGAADFSDPSVLTSLITSASRLTIADGSAQTLDLRMVVLK